MKEKHYVLVHGSCHGAWCWFKLKPLLQSSGHKVTVLDLAASGINPKRIEDVHTFSEYSEPLMKFLESLPPNEKVILVGHSFGGLSLALAMDNFPHKIALAVFLAAFLPDTQHKPSYVLEKYNERMTHIEWMDTEFSSQGFIKSIFLFGSEFLSTYLYQLCSNEDIELAKTLVRRGSLYTEDLSKSKNLSQEGYGTVTMAYIICNEDLVIPMEFQKWMIENAGIHDHDVEEINGADHMAMLSKPHQLHACLLQIADKHNC